MRALHYNRSDKYPFLHERLLKEPYLDEMLTEIEAYQKSWRKNKKTELATAESLNESRNIKIPITQKRLLNIQYLIDLLIRYNSEEFKPLYSYHFSVNPENKNLVIEEKTELTFLITEKDYHELVASRDSRSTESLMQLLSSFRLFNLTKLIKKAKNKQHLSQLIKAQLGKNIFTFKNYSLDKSGFDMSEDFCFHKNNYEHVKLKIDIDSMRKIIESNNAAITRRLKNFGILNANVSDYRDTKFNYILNTLTGEMAVALDKKDLLTVKNFQSLRDCIIKVDKILDPLLLNDSEIMNHISENIITTENNIISLFEGINSENFGEWESDKKNAGKIISLKSSDGLKYIIDSLKFLDKFTETVAHLTDSSRFNSLSESQKDEKIFVAEILAEAAGNILAEDNPLKILGTSERLKTMNQLLHDYDALNKRIISEKQEAQQKKAETQKSSSILVNIVTAVISLFSRKQQAQPEKNVSRASTSASTQRAAAPRPSFSKETRDVYAQIKSRDSNLIPISDFIEIQPENESRLDQVISELRANNLKIVIPVYNARQVLYPVRSKKYLMSDVEYLLVDPEVAKTPESLGAFMESISSFKFKEDHITTNALFSIEKYLNSILRKNRSKAKRRA